MTTTQVFDIAVLPGDGTGAEVMNACLGLLRAAQVLHLGPQLHSTVYEAGAQHYARADVALPEATLDACRQSHAVLFGAMGWPGVRHADGTEPAPQLDLRMGLDLYAGVRPIRWFPGLPAILSDERARHIDFVLVREQTEGLFYSRGRGRVEADSEAYDTLKITRAGTARVSEFAFKLAAQRKALRKPSTLTGEPSARVTCVDKSNVFASMAFFRKIFDEVAAGHPDIGHDHAYVDATALTMVKNPWSLDVLVTENMFGDILSDLGAGLIGGMGMAPSGDIGDQHALFQPAHGSAPDIAGQGKANPCAMFLSAAMMLDWLALRHREPRLAIQARVIEQAIEQVLSTRAAVPMDYGGGAGTLEVTTAVIEAMPSALRAVAP